MNMDVFTFEITFVKSRKVYGSKFVFRCPTSTALLFTLANGCHIPYLSFVIQLK